MRTEILFATIMLLVIGSSAWDQTAPTDHWASIRFMVGSWEGTASGQAGVGTVLRHYKFILRGRYLREVSKSTYPSQDQNHSGEVHEHLGVFSYDKARKAIVLRQFHVEGFVNHYVLSSESTTDKLIFESENFENFSNEWRAREIYEVVSTDEFIEIFELAPPGKPFETYSKNHFRRVRE